MNAIIKNVLEPLAVWYDTPGSHRDHFAQGYERELRESGHFCVNEIV